MVKGGKQRRKGIEGDEGGLGVVNGHLMVVKSIFQIMNFNF